MDRPKREAQLNALDGILANLPDASVDSLRAAVELQVVQYYATVRHYVALRLTILDDIGWVMLMNPGTLIRLVEIGDQHKERLIRDIHDGTLTDQFEIPTAIRGAGKSRQENNKTVAVVGCVRVAASKPHGPAVGKRI